jgi:hypothetical protein
MNTFFCAEESRGMREDPIASADNYAQFYFFVECPPPWTKNAFDSKNIPENLRSLDQQIYDQEMPVFLLLIYNEQLWQPNLTRLLVYWREEGLSNRYHKQEYQFTSLEEVVPVIKEYLLQENLPIRNTTDETRDIFICTHGSQDKCCAKYGYPFYRQALATVANLYLNHVRIWQVSHFGGHRFAPTALDFPEGRFYARLDKDSFTSILTRTGDINCFKKIYRGWSILPESVQVLEREMILMHGWHWFDYQVVAIAVESKDNCSLFQVEIQFKKFDGSLGIVRADIVEDQNKAMYLIGDCDGTQTSKIPQFLIQNLIEM